MQCEHFSVCFELSDGTADCRCPECDLSDDQPVCDASGATHINRCFVNRLNCLKKTSIRTVKEGACSKFLEVMNDVVWTLI